MQLTKEKHQPIESPAVKGRWWKDVLFRPIVVGLLIFAVANYLLMDCTTSMARAQLFKKGTALPLEKTFTGWTALAYINQDRAPDVVLMGSSQMGSATFSAEARRLGTTLDCVTHRQSLFAEDYLQQAVGHPLRVFNWALAGSMVSDDYIISRLMFNGSMRPKLIIVGVSPRDFMDNALPCPGATEAFRFFSRFLDTRYLTPLAFPDFMGRLGWMIDSLPLRRLGADWHRSMDTKLSRETDSHKLQDEDDNAAGGTATGGRSNSPKFLQAVSTTATDVAPHQWLMPSNMPPIFEDNTDEYLHRYKRPDPPIYPAEMELFKRFLTRMHDLNVEVLVVGMPSLGPNRSLLPDSFWSSWRCQIASLCGANQDSWFDLTDSSQFEIYDFLDTVHMNARGGNKLFKILAEHVAQEPGLKASLERTKL